MWLKKFKDLFFKTKIKELKEIADETNLEIWDKVIEYLQDENIRKQFEKDGIKILKQGDIYVNLDEINSRDLSVDHSRSRME